MRIIQESKPGPPKLFHSPNPAKIGLFHSPNPRGERIIPQSKPLLDLHQDYMRPVAAAMSRRMRVRPGSPRSFFASRSVLNS